MLCCVIFLIIYSCLCRKVRVTGHHLQMSGTDYVEINIANSLVMKLRVILYRHMMYLTEVTTCQLCWRYALRLMDKPSKRKLLNFWS